MARDYDYASIFGLLFIFHMACLLAQDCDYAATRD
jgi:hypothetical protein